MAIGIIVMTGVIYVSFSNQSSLISSATNADAIMIAKKTIENERALARQDFNLVNSNTSTETIGGITYTKTITVTLMSDYLTKQVTAVISWIGEKGQSYSTTLTTLVTSLDNVNSPQVCNSALSNADGWKTPDDEDFDFQQLLYGNNSNGLQLSSVHVFDKKMYVVASSPPANPGDSETFFVLDVSDPSSAPDFLGSVDNNTASDKGANAVTVAKQNGIVYAFLANARDSNFNSCTQGQDCAQLQVVNANTPSSPSMISSANYMLSRTAAPFVKGSGGQAVGNSIYYANNYVYLGLTATSKGAAFHIIDVSNPSSPTWVGSWPNYAVVNSGSGGSVDSISVKGKYAYIGHSNSLIGEDGNATNEQLTVLDITNPANPVRVRGYGDSTGTAGAGGKSTMALGSTLYFGRSASNTSGSADSIDEFYILNNPDPSTTAITKTAGTSLALSEGINSVVVREYLAFLLTTTEFKVLNISNTSSITTWGSLPLPGNGGSAFDCEGDRFFVINDLNKDHVSVVSPADPTDYTLSNSGNIALTAGGSSGNTTITKTSVLNPRSVTLSASGVPSGATATFSNNPCTPTCSSTLTINPGTAANGTYTVTVVGSPNGTSNPSTSFTLTIKATPTITASVHNSSHAVITTIPAGNTAHPNAAVSGGSSPTGTVTFSYYTNGTCAGTAANTSSAIALSSGTADAATFAQGPLNAGTYSFKAHYDGDTNNNAADSACTTLTVTKLTPTIVTAIKNSSGTTITSAPVGTVVHDRATVTGTFGTPTGTVTFTVSKNKTNCGNPTQSGWTGTLSGGIADSINYTTTNDSSYQAVYSGDANYNAVTAACEPLPKI